MHPDLDKLATLLDEYNEKGDEAVLRQAIIDGTFKADEVPEDIRKRTEAILNLKKKILDNDDLRIVSEDIDENGLRSRPDIEEDAALEILKRLKSGKSLDSESLRNACVSLVSDSAYIGGDQELYEWAIKARAAFELSAKRAGKGGWGVVAVDEMKSKHPDIDFDETIAETFHAVIKEGKWEHAWQIFDYYLSYDSANDVHIARMSEKARAILAMRYIESPTYDIHPLEHPNGLESLSASIAEDVRQHPEWDSSAENITGIIVERAELDFIRTQRESIRRLLKGGS